MERSGSFNHHTASNDSQNSWNRETGFGANDRRLAFSRQASLKQWHEPPHTPIPINSDDSAKPLLSRNMSINIPTGGYFASESNKLFRVKENSGDKLSVLSLSFSILENVRSGNRYMKRLFLMISLNVLYSTAELAVGLLTGRIGIDVTILFPLLNCEIYSLYVKHFSYQLPY